MGGDVDARAAALAEVIDGEVVDAEGRVAVSIKGVVAGFPATLEAIYPKWPFGVMYQLETSFSADPSDNPQPRPSAKITIYPRVGRGFTSFLTKLLLFESASMPVGDSHMEKMFNFSYDNRDVAERLVRYPGVSEHLTRLENVAKFSEMVIKTDTGIYLAQPTALDSLDEDVCRETFTTLADIGRILFEAF